MCHIIELAMDRILGDSIVFDITQILWSILLQLTFLPIKSIFDY